MATFNGSNIFGINVVMTAAPHSRAEQKDAFHGVNGLERKDGGARGGLIRVTGLLYGGTPLLLAAAEQTFRNLHNGVPYTLVDTLGLTWLNAKLIEFQPNGRAMLAGNGNYYREYSATFEVP